MSLPLGRRGEWKLSLGLLPPRYFEARASYISLSYEDLGMLAQAFRGQKQEAPPLRCVSPIPVRARCYSTFVAPRASRLLESSPGLPFPGFRTVELFTSRVLLVLLFQARTFFQREPGLSTPAGGITATWLPAPGSNQHSLLSARSFSKGSVPRAFRVPTDYGFGPPLGVLPTAFHQSAHKPRLPAESRTMSASPPFLSWGAMG